MLEWITSVMLTCPKQFANSGTFGPRFTLKTRCHGWWWFSIGLEPPELRWRVAGTISKNPQKEGSTTAAHAAAALGSGAKVAKTAVDVARLAGLESRTEQSTRSTRAGREAMDVARVACFQSKGREAMDVARVAGFESNGREAMDVARVAGLESNGREAMDVARVAGLARAERGETWRETTVDSFAAQSATSSASLGWQSQWWHDAECFCRKSNKPREPYEINETSFAQFWESNGWCYCGKPG